MLLGDPVPKIVWRASSQGPEQSKNEINKPVESITWRSSSPEPISGPGEPQVNGLGNPTLSPSFLPLPRELEKVTLPPYVIEPPDLLVISVARVVPRLPYRIEALDEIHVQAREVLPQEPINGTYTVDGQGQIDLGYSYGKVAVAGLTPEEATSALKRHLAANPGIVPQRLAVTLARVPGLPPIQGEHSVRMDGMVSLGTYGEVQVAGMTLAEAGKAISAQLSKRLLNPEVAVNVATPNSKFYYLIYDTDRSHQQILRFPIVGGETVLDALSRLPGLSTADKRIWIARPAPGSVGRRQILPVDFTAMADGGVTDTNYQLFPGDRVHVRTVLLPAPQTKVTYHWSTPFERVYRKFTPRQWIDQVFWGTLE
jgi:protein involved in polysaccharide export with SLBB domain